MSVSVQHRPGRWVRGCLATFALIALALIALALLIAPLAQAAVPANDEIGAATAITSVPYTDAVDTTEATTAADDPNCVGNGPTVWYTFTPSSDRRLEANTIGSTFDTTISVYTGSPGALTQIACNDDAVGLQSQVVFDAAGGQTLYIMAGSCCGQGGGSLTFALADGPPPPQCADGSDNDLDGLTDGADPGCDGPFDDDETDPPPPLQLSLTLNSSGSVDANGVARVDGSVTCDQPAFVSLGGGLTQTFARRFTVQGFGNSGVNCTPPSVPWTMTVSAFNGNLFAAGPARATVNAFGCTNTSCASANTAGDVRLRAQRRP